jgi:hypothetical protein
MTSQRTVMQSAVAAGLAALVAFAWAVTFEFVYDDRWTVVHNRWLDAPLRTLLSAALNGSAHAQGIPDATRPSAIVSFWIDRRLFGLSPAGHHAHSVVLYVFSSAAAAFAAHSLLRDARAALVAGLFFALAPVHAEAVSAVNYREDLIAGLGLLVPLAWLFRESTAKDTLPEGLGVSLVWLWGLLGKESAAVLPALVGVIALLRSADRAWLEARERTLWLLLAAGVLWVNWRLAIAIGDDGIPRAAPSAAATRFFDTARFALRAVTAALFPLRPSPEHPGLEPTSPWWGAGLMSLLGFMALLTRRPATRGAALGLWLALLAPLGASPLVGPVNAWADRYVFVGVLGGGIFYGNLLTRAAGHLPRRAVVSMGTVLLLAATAACISAASVWATERRLWSYAVTRAPTSARAWAALARVERLDGNLDEADRLLDRALAANPRDPAARVTRVYNLLARGDLPAARAAIVQAEKVGARAHPGLARARRCAALDAEDAKRCIREGY